jgi:hypothetical protein
MCMTSRQVYPFQVGILRLFRFDIFRAGLFGCAMLMDMKVCEEFMVSVEFGFVCTGCWWDLILGVGVLIRGTRY